MLATARLTNGRDSVDYQIVIVTIAGSAIYVWLTLVAAPIATAVRSATIHATSASAAWRVAVGSVLLITTIAAAALVLAILAVPTVAQFVLEGPEVLRGLQFGSILWAARSAVLGLPSIAPEREIAIASAAAALGGLDATARASLEHQYRSRMLDAAPLQLAAGDRLRAV